MEIKSEDINRADTFPEIQRIAESPRQAVQGSTDSTSKK